MIDLRQGDCLTLLPQLPAGSVDCVIADLPFGTTRNAWDCPIPTHPLWESLTRVCKPNAAMLFFSQMPFAAELVTSNLTMFRYEWIWRKSNKTGFLNAKKMPLKEHENVLVFYQRLPTYNPQMQNGKTHTRGKAGTHTSNYGKCFKVNSGEFDEYYPSDVLSFKSVWNNAEKQVHPTQKPVPLLEYLIRTYTNPGETVLDPTMGSGSAGVAAVNTGRGFVGIELDPGYFAIAQGRVKAAQDAVSGAGIQDSADAQNAATGG